MNQHQLSRLIRVARGDIPADLILANARIVNTLNGEVEQNNVAICGESIAGIGDYGDAREAIDIGGNFVAPALINGHTHVESSMLHIAQYARAAVPRGTSAIVTDLHEIADVCRLGGAKQILQIAEDLPLDVF